ncbi:unnamed protein product, partial [marine sediment metagenome]
RPEFALGFNSSQEANQAIKGKADGYASRVDGATTYHRVADSIVMCRGEQIARFTRSPRSVG